jgi:predicted NBD/HSP70 family sugar kinase
MAERAMRTVRDLRRSNRALLLGRLYFGGPLSRQDLIDTTSLSAASVSNVVGGLIEDGLVVEAGAVESEGGRPRILLRVDSTAWHAIGVDVGETRVLVELFTLDLAVVARAQFPLPDGCGDVGFVVGHIHSGLRTVIVESGVRTDSIIGVGIGVPGVVEHRVVEHRAVEHSAVERGLAGRGSAGRGLVERGLVEHRSVEHSAPGHRPGGFVYGQSIGWDGVPLEDLVRQGTDLPLFVDNGATTLGQAEMWLGAGRGARDAVIALIGSGVGACVVTDGSPYRGTGRSAGEWGHTTVQVGGRPCRCGSLGCLEAYVGAEGVLAGYRELCETGGGSAETLSGFGEEAALARVLAAADGGEKAAQEVLAGTALYLGAGIANLINLFNPERIVLGGWAGLALGARLLPRVREIAGQYALRHAYAHSEIVLGRLGPDAVARGAATLPVERFLAAAAPPITPTQGSVLLDRSDPNSSPDRVAGVG